jgi:hypothetical protein
MLECQTGVNTMAVTTEKVLQILGKEYSERFLDTMYNAPVHDLVAEIMLRMDEKEIHEILKQYQDEE